jgi:hypothetical protein
LSLPCTSKSMLGWATGKPVRRDTQKLRENPKTEQSHAETQRRRENPTRFCLPPHSRATYCGRHEKASVFTRVPLLIFSAAPRLCVRNAFGVFFPRRRGEAAVCLRRNLPTRRSREGGIEQSTEAYHNPTARSAYRAGYGGTKQCFVNSLLRPVASRLWPPPARGKRVFLRRNFLLFAYHSTVICEWRTKREEATWRRPSTTALFPVW